MKRIYKGYQISQLERQPDQLGESLEQQLRRMRETGEKVEAIAPMIYTDKKDGVQPQYDPRTDKQEIALDAIEKSDKSEIMRGTENEKLTEKETNEFTELEV